MQAFKTLVVVQGIAETSRGVYTIESLEQMLQKNFKGGRFDVEPGGECIRKKILLCLLKILVTIAVSSCSAERVMSRVKIIKNRLRSTMNDDWFSSLTILASERDVMDSLAATDIIDTFAQCSSKLQNMLGVHCALSACGDNN